MSKLTYLFLIILVSVLVSSCVGMPDGVRPVEGFEVNRYYKNFVLSPYIDYNISYDGDLYGFNVGIYVGYCFRSKRN